MRSIASGKNASKAASEKRPGARRRASASEERKRIVALIGLHEQTIGADFAETRQARELTMKIAHFKKKLTTAFSRTASKKSPLPKHAKAWFLGKESGRLAYMQKFRAFAERKGALKIYLEYLDREIDSQGKKIAEIEKAEF
ncbi:MAG: hypothetical protein WC634_02675 [archaeon]